MSSHPDIEALNKISEVLAQAFSKVKFISEQFLKNSHHRPHSQHQPKKHENSIREEEKPREGQSKKEQKEKKEKLKEKQKKERFADKPKHPSTSYIQFTTDNMSKVKEEYPDLGHTEVVSVISKIWNQLSQEEKLPYDAQYNREMEVYKEELAQFYNRHPEQRPRKTKQKK